MKKMLLAIIVGCVLGLAASAATKSEPNFACGPRICLDTQECCVIGGHPFSYRCVKPGTCPD